jgi:glutathione synthase/RimK-type ligase-like ATP-grasp enzyme
MTDPRRPTVALATCAARPELDGDGPGLLAALDRAGVDARAAIWDDPAEAWGRFDLVVVRSTWDYTERRDQFVAWARSVPRLANPAEVVEWNTDKRYLDDLAAAGVPVVPTTWIGPDDPVTLPTGGEFVVKPAVSAGARGAGRHRPDRAAGAADHVRALQALGHWVMVQPYLATVEQFGEAGLIYIDGRFSHAIRKGQVLRSPGAGARDPGDVAITPVAAASTERERAEQVLAAVPGSGPLLYARVDLLRGPSGECLLSEVELTEPSLFLGDAIGSTQRLAQAVAARARYR